MGRTRELQRYLANHMDKTLVNLISILVTGSGLFAVLTKFNVPELSGTFWGHNPFMIKRDAIDTTMTWIFASLALFGLLAQVFAEIVGDALPDRLYTSSSYVVFFIGGLVCTTLLVFLLGSIGKRLARRKWFPRIIESNTEGFRSIQSILANDGWREDQLAHKDSIPDPENYRKKNLEQASQRLAQIEKLLELSNVSDDLEPRIRRLRPYFDEQRAT